MSEADRLVTTLGDSALSVVFAGDDALAVNAKVHALASTVRTAASSYLRDVVPGMRELVVHIDPLRCDLEALWQLLQTPVSECADERTARTVDVPVTYGGESGPDLQTVADQCGLHVDDVCALHAAREYVVCFLGFLPGFPYLGLLDESLRLPRRASPRPRVPAGAVAIAGEYSGIYPSVSPGGWHLIGHTPLTLFDVDAAATALLAPGNRVRFVPR